MRRYFIGGDSMLNRKVTAGLLAAGIAVSAFGLSALAAENGAEKPAEKEVVSVIEPVSGREPDTVGSVSFENLETRMRENGLGLLALDETIASIEVLDYEKMSNELRDKINWIADMQWGSMHMQVGEGYMAEMLAPVGKAVGSIAASSMQSTHTSLKETFDSIKDGEMQADNAAIVRQLQNLQTQTVIGGQNLYVVLVELENNYAALERSLASLDRTLEELTLRYQMGQISTLTLQEAKNGRTALLSGMETLQMNIENCKLQLEMLLGAEMTGEITLQDLPELTEEVLNAANLETDLAKAKAASYQLFEAQRTLEDAKEEYEDAVDEYGENSKKYQFTSAKHSWQAAQYTFDAELQQFENGFRTLYLQMEDCRQILKAAQVALTCERDSYAADVLKYQQGNISQNALLTAEDDLKTAEEKVTSAEIDLFSAYQAYRCAVEYGIVN